MSVWRGIPVPRCLKVLYGTSSSTSLTVPPHHQHFALQPRVHRPQRVCRRRRKRKQRITCLQRMSGVKGRPGKASHPFDMEAGQKLLDVRSDVEPPIRELKQDVPRLDDIRGETLAVVGGGHFPFSCAGEIEVKLSRQAQGIAEQGAQQDRRGWPPAIGPHHELERWVRASRHITRRNQPRAVLHKKFGEYTRHLSPPTTLSPFRNIETIWIAYTVYNHHYILGQSGAG